MMNKGRPIPRLALMLPTLTVLLLPELCQAAPDQEQKDKKPAPAVRIVSPINKSVVRSTPVTLEIGFSNGSDPNHFKALLNGTDITSLFGPVSGGTRQAHVNQPAINLGKNQFQVTAGKRSERSHAIFFFKPATSPGPPPGDSQGSALLVPVQTRVLVQGTDGTHASDYEIVVGGTPYPAPTPSDGGNTGFQVLVLNRSNLTKISNNSYSTANIYALGGFEGAIGPFGNNNPCGAAGCLEIIQSLGTIGTNCSTDGADGPLNPAECNQYTNALANIGASKSLPYANGDDPDVAYSFIGNVGSQVVPAGSFYERLTCSSSSGCDNGTLLINQTAPSGAKPNQIGNISGALILDNYFNYTYTPTTPTINFSSVHIKNSNGTLANLVTIGNLQDCCESAELPAAANGQVGGFQLVVVDPATMTVLFNQTYSVPYISGSSDVRNIAYLASDIQSSDLLSRGHVFFLASIGNLDHYGSCWDDTNPVCYPNPQNQKMSPQDVWDQIAQAVHSLGGTYATFELLNQPCNNDGCQSSFSEDDYTLVGVPVPDPSITGLPPAYSAENSSQISRQTVVNPPTSSDIYGFLKLDHQGYYKPDVNTAYPGFTQEVVSNIISASTLPPTPWPFADDAGHDAAYTWISEQLCCEDIRSAYTNLNANPETWLILLLQLDYDPSVPGFTEDDFDDMKSQLSTEFQYVALVRQFQNNVTSLYQDQQSNVSLILQEASDTVLGALDISSQQQTSSASWTGILKDVFAVSGPVSSLLPPPNGDVVKIALGFGSALIDQATAHTNNSAGNPLIAQEQELTTAGDLARKAADEFAASLVSLGGDFDRTVSDWGRLQALGTPLRDNQIEWDASASGLLLQAFDLSTRRDFFTKIMLATYTVDHYEYSAPDANENDAYNSGCDIKGVLDDQDPVSWAWLPGTMIAGPTAPITYNYEFRHDLWWDAWFIGVNGYDTSCPSGLPTAPFFHLFDPVDPNNTANLGLYKPWFFQRSGFNIAHPIDSYYNNYPQKGDPDDY